MKKNIYLLLIFTFWYSPVLASEWDITIGLQGQSFNYRELDEQAGTLLSENGFIPGLDLSLSYHQQPFFLSTQIHYVKGSVDYDGQTQSGIPLTTTTKSELGSWYSSAGWNIEDNVAVLLRLSEHYWDRDIQATNTTGNLFERYSWNQAGVGLQIRHDINPKSIIRLHGVLSKTHKPQVLVDLRPYGGENVLLELGTETSIELGSEWLYKMSPSFALGLGAKYQKYRFEKSESKTTSLNSTSIGISEPSSKTELINLSLFLRFFL